MKAVGRIKSSWAAWARRRKGRRSCCANIEMKREKKNHCAILCVVGLIDRLPKPKTCTACTIFPNRSSYLRSSCVLKAVCCRAVVDHCRCERMLLKFVKEKWNLINLRWHSPAFCWPPRSLLRLVSHLASVSPRGTRLHLQVLPS